MTRSTDHEVRRKEILSIAIEFYLNTAQPVSSEALRRTRRTNLSSASVRNVFSELEKIGMLTHPHTSAGRVPTDEGYRFYINVLMKKRELTAEEINFIDKIYEMKVRELNSLFYETSRIMSDFTHYVSLVCFDDEEAEKIHFQGLQYLLEHPEFCDVRRIHMLLEALDKRDELVGLIKREFSAKTKVYIGKECNCSQMEYCSVIVTNCDTDNRPGGRLALIGPKRMAYDKVIPLMNYISDVVVRNVETRF